MAKKDDMDIKIRLARPEDEDEILSVIGSSQFPWDRRNAKKYFEDYFDDIVPLRGDRTYILMLNSKIEGVIGYSVDRYETNNCWINWFYVRKKYQGKGYGKKLISHLAMILKRKGIKKLFVETSMDESYRMALNIYLDQGFRIEAIIRDYYEKGEDQIILSKAIR